MPFKSKKSASKVGNTGGRNPSDYSKLSDTEKSKYHRQAIMKHRYPDGKKSGTQDATKRILKSPTKRKVGRTPLGLVAMSPNKLRVRMTFLNRSRWKKDRISKIRKTSVLKRWQSEKSGDGKDDEGDDESETETIESDNESNESDATDATDCDNGSAVTIENNLELSNLNENIPSRTAVWRWKCQLRGVLTTDPVDNMNILIAFNKRFEFDAALTKEISKLSHPGNMSERQYNYRASKVVDIFERMRSYSRQVAVMTFWLDQLLSHSVIEAIFKSCNVLIPESYVPKSYMVSRKAADLSSKYLSCSSRSPLEVRKNSIKFLIELAKTCELSSSNKNDSYILANVTSCHHEFTKKVLVAIDSCTEEELLALRRPRIDAIRYSEWPTLIKKFVLLPENSRPVPGQQQVSVRYGVRLPKFLLLRSRDFIAFDFKQQYPDCKYSIATIKREFPQNAVTPTSRDLERNTCPVHANTRRLVKQINRAIRKHNSNIQMLPSSCRELATSVMCHSPTVSSLQPTTWCTECVTGSCKNCPGLQLDLPVHLLRQSVTFSLWERKKVNVTKMNKSKETITVEKNVFSLYPQTISMEEAVLKLGKMLNGLKWHIYTAHRQWTAHDIQRSNLDFNSIITIEDYQMNVEVVYNENPTSLAYSTNKKSIALYPICVEFINGNGELCKGAISFLSNDKLHDHQQAEAFEIEAFQIIRERLEQPIYHWKRFADGCSAQFRSRFTSASMFSMKKKLGLQSISYDYFEANEGKNVSDTIGSIVKCAFLRGMQKKDEGLRDLSEMLQLIKSEIKSSTNKFQFFLVEQFGQTERLKVRNELKIPNITKVHSIVLVEKSLVARWWTCLECRTNHVCESCKSSPTVSTNSMKQSVVENDEDDNAGTDENRDEDFYDSEDNGYTDQSDSDVESESASDDDEDMGPGDVVWALHGRIWYPGCLCDMADLPEDIQKNFKNPSGKFIVKWYGENQYSLASKVELLAENRLDAQRASKSADMQQAYNLALEDLNY